MSTPSQTLIFVVLPNGLTAGKTLSLSLYLTPRLDNGAQLSAFPDILQWPRLIKTSGLTFTLSCGGQTANVAANQGVLRPDIWNQIFTPDTFVAPYQNPAYDQRLIVSYPVRDALAYLRWVYQSAGSGMNTGDADRSGLRFYLRNLVFRQGQQSTLAAALSNERLAMWIEQHPKAIILAPPKATPPPPVGPDGVPTSVTEPANTLDTITRFALFHNLPPAPNRPPLPSTPADFAQMLDFHKALTALNSYPALLRALGLVFDVEVPLSFCPASPNAGVYGTIAVSAVTPGFQWSIAPSLGLPSTAYVQSASSFAAAPATAAGDLSAGSYLAGDVIDGFLALSPQNFLLLGTDLDGALLKALGLADNVANANDPSVTGDTLPSLRSGGIGLVANGRGLQLLQSIENNQAFNTALADNSWPRPFNIRDLVRGYRIDIWSSKTKQWSSLHRRNATYRFGPQLALSVATSDEEGFLQPAATQPAEDPTRTPDSVATTNNIPQPGTDVYIHERVARWDGWSLSAFRPGLPLNRSVDPGQALDPDPTMNQPVTPFKMTTSFTAMPGSLPELRFGRGYQLRARAVDLAGNSLSWKSTVSANLVLPAGGTLLTYFRYEPVPYPILVPLQPPGAGGSLERLVIRSYNSSEALDSTPATEIDQRHIAPPRAAVRMVEQHGMLDDSNGKLRGDAATYNLITTRDAYEIPIQNGIPTFSGPQLAVSWLPDPIARGAAFCDLPNAPNNSSGQLNKNALTYSTLPDVQPRRGSVTYIDFGSPWPSLSAFRLALAEGSGKPAWNSTARVLTIYLEKGNLVETRLSCYLLPADLDLMGVWNWIRQFFEALEAASMQNASAAFEVPTYADILALVTRLVLEGGHEMITPARTLTLVHAVQQPLGRPVFVQLPVIHQVSNPILASGLHNSFTPITAWRTHGSHNAVLLGGLAINAASSAKIDLQASWPEVTDNTSKPGPASATQTAHVETIDLSSTSAGPIYSDATDTRMVAVYIPKVDTLWFSAPIDDLDGVATPSEIAAPVHRFDDTKHRFVTYTATATSRFQEYFQAGLDFTRVSDPLTVDVPSSARPLAPEIVYVVPTFGWENQESSNVKSSVRFGNGLRVYLDRPWFSSGDSELLAVVLWPSSMPAPDYATRDQYKPYFTQWGNDPIWTAGQLSAVPATSDLCLKPTTATNLSLEETSALTVDIAAHPVVYDEQRRLWFCDIQFNNPSSYAPFVRLALARYQSHSIHGCELSKVVLADYAQLSPTRSAIVSINPSDPRTARVFVGGVAPDGPVQSEITVTVESRIANVLTDLGWQLAGPSAVTVTEDSPAPAQPAALLWSGSIQFAKTPAPGQFRVVIREYERIRTSYLVLPPNEWIPPITVGQRLVYAAILPYDYPGAG